MNRKKNWVALFKNNIRQVVVLEVLGYSVINRIFMYIFQLACISLISLILGNIISIYLIWVQKTFNFVKLDSIIYFTNSLPVLYDLNFNFRLTMLVMIITLFFGILYFCI